MIEMGGTETYFKISILQRYACDKGIEQKVILTSLLMTQIH